MEEKSVEFIEKGAALYSTVEDRCVVATVSSRSRRVGSGDDFTFVAGGLSAVGTPSLQCESASPS
jgi:hypothetical protein